MTKEPAGQRLAEGNFDEGYAGDKSIMPSTEGLDIVGFLTWAAFVARDPAAILALVAAGTGLFVVVIGLLIQNGARLDGKLTVSGLAAWLVAAAGCLAPLHKGVIATRSWVIVALLLSRLLRLLMITVYRWGKGAL